MGNFIRTFCRVRTVILTSPPRRFSAASSNMYRTIFSAPALALYFVMAGADAKYGMSVRDTTSAVVASQLSALNGDGWLEVKPAHWLVRALPASCPANHAVHDTSMRVVEAVFGPAIFLAGCTALRVALSHGPTCGVIGGFVQAR